MCVDLLSKTSQGRIRLSLSYDRKVAQTRKKRLVLRLWLRKPSHATFGRVCRDLTSDNSRDENCHSFHPSQNIRRLD